MKRIRKHISFYGMVQGVGFRYRAKHAAEAAGATGWVRNEPDGSVTMEIQGTEEQIRYVIDMIGQGSYICIDDLVQKEIEADDDERYFEYRWD